VPLRILGLGLDESQVVEADVFLLTDERPQLLAGGPGLEIARSASASSALLDDLRSDVGMGWVPEEMWLSYLRLEAPAGDLDYDLAVSAEDGRNPSPVDAGIRVPQEAVAIRGSDGPQVLALAVAVALTLGLVGLALRRTATTMPPVA
jgi:hypothetical protein